MSKPTKSRADTIRDCLYIFGAFIIIGVLMFLEMKS